MRTINRVIRIIAGFLADIVKLYFFIFEVALGFEKEVRLGFKVFCDAFVTAFAGISIVATVKGSPVWTGILYFISSAEKWLGIMWSPDVTWSHWLSGGRYEAFGEYKENLIASDKFAGFLSDLGGHGGIAKVFQIILLLVCIVMFLFMVYVLIKCLKHFVLDLIKLIKRINVNSKKRKIRRMKKRAMKYDRTHHRPTNNSTFPEI